MRQLQDQLKELGFKTSFKKKQDAQDMLDSIRWPERFPWHEDQKAVLDWGLTDGNMRESVVQGVFGAGKTTLMTGIFCKVIYERIFTGTSVMICAFNVSIRNELRKKIRGTGLKQRPMVRTFDSLVYELCRHFGMPGLDKPDYEGRRRFVERILVKPDEETQYERFQSLRLVLVDEAQDLDTKAYDLLRRFFPNAHFFFFGDIFQCIQKEPRCSLLWSVLQPAPQRRVLFMKKTPRVPRNILEEIKNALVHHYPEYNTPISNWYSSNPLPDSETTIEWIPIGHYAQVFKKCKEFLDKHPHKDCMVLTFSSAITVRGSLGDLSRFRQFLMKENIPVNRNYKSMDDDKLFLSTVNSSKGLERPYVFIALTFPLELAFANFSNDLVVNLVSVGLSRCKTSAVFCVPIYSDRFSDVLRLYPRCPTPQSEASSVNLRKKKEMSEKPIMSTNDINDFLEKEHSATEILRQGILSFSTRSDLRSCAKMSTTSPSFPQGSRIKWSMRNEEEASFMGVLYEVLITSIWSRRWPTLDVCGMNDISKNPMYTHVSKDIGLKFKRLVKAFHQPFAPSRMFDVLYDYTEYHILTSQKTRVNVAPPRKEEMRSAWMSLEKDISSLRPNFPVHEPQVNLCRPFITGVADMICGVERHKNRNGPSDEDQVVEEDRSATNNVIYEIKTCTNSDWKDDAFTQAALYMSMTPSKRGVIRLVNPFRREMVEYNIALTSKQKNIMTIVDREMMLWNLNCFLAKFKEENAILPPLPFPIQNVACVSGDMVLEFLAPTKTRISLLSDVAKKHHVRFDPVDPIFDGMSAPDDLTPWLLAKIDYRHAEDCKTHVQWSDPFSQCVLLAIFLRKSFSFRNSSCMLT